MSFIKKWGNADERCQILGETLGQPGGHGPIGEVQGQGAAGITIKG
jgi:hypothetical protein